jgi:hypothetical protein
MKTILEDFKNLSLTDMNICISKLTEIRNTIYEEKFRILDIYNRDGNIAEKIHEETGLSCYHVSAGAGNIGTNKIIIPVDKYGKEFCEELISKYDNIF